jgi:hypothetical protein
MTPQEKAKELLEKMNVIHYLKGNGLPVSMHKSQIKQCALIAVDELIKQEEKHNNGTFYPSNYWQEVKEEMEKL